MHSQIEVPSTNSVERWCGERVTYLRINGALVLGQETTTFRAEVQKLIVDKSVAVVVDLGDVKRFDPAGLGALVELDCVTRRRKIDVLVCFPRRTPDLLILIRLFTLFGGRMLSAS